MTMDTALGVKLLLLPRQVSLSLPLCGQMKFTNTINTATLFFHTTNQVSHYKAKERFVLLFGLGSSNCQGQNKNYSWCIFKLVNCTTREIWGRFNNKHLWVVYELRSWYQQGCRSWNQQGCWSWERGIHSNPVSSHHNRQCSHWLNVAKCNLGKVNLEAMQVSSFSPTIPGVTRCL